VLINPVGSSLKLALAVSGLSPSLLPDGVTPSGVGPEHRSTWSNREWNSQPRSTHIASAQKDLHLAKHDLTNPVGSSRKKDKRGTDCAPIESMVPPLCVQSKRKECDLELIWNI
jgi:hypothetical protein